MAPGFDSVTTSADSEVSQILLSFFSTISVKWRIFTEMVLNLDHQESGALFQCVCLISEGMEGKREREREKHRLKRKRKREREEQIMADCDEMRRRVEELAQNNQSLVRALQSKSEKLREVKRRLRELEEEVRKIEDAREFYMREVEKVKEMKKFWRLSLGKDRRKDETMERLMKAMKGKDLEVVENLRFEENEEEEEEMRSEGIELMKECEENDEGGEDEEKRGCVEEMSQLTEEERGETIYFAGNSYDSAVHRRVAFDLLEFCVSLGMKKTKAYLRTCSAVGVSLRTLYRWKHSYSKSGVISGKKHSGGKHIPLFESEDLAKSARKWCRNRSRDGFTARDFLDEFLSKNNETSMIRNIKTARAYLQCLGFAYST